jgi:hypothetical protein
MIGLAPATIAHRKGRNFLVGLRDDAVVAALPIATLLRPAGRAAILRGGWPNSLPQPTRLMVPSHRCAPPCELAHHYHGSEG